jgi:hypothetical protein|tara:strand:- start:1010 stop:1246 length:237 start_codon:yes stop_codon:yes gene_type:complete
MIEKTRLKHSISYFGTHELTAVAKWDSRKECFWYVSLDYSQPVLVSLRHPTDGGSFVPLGELLCQVDNSIFGANRETA